MFSYMSVCRRGWGGSHVTITHDALELTGMHSCSFQVFTVLNWCNVLKQWPLHGLLQLTETCSSQAGEISGNISLCNPLLTAHWSCYQSVRLDTGKYDIISAVSCNVTILSQIYMCLQRWHRAEMFGRNFVHTRHNKWMALHCSPELFFKIFAQEISTSALNQGV